VRIATITSNRFLTALPIAGLLLALYFISRFNFLLFHSLAELFTVLITGAIFMLAWNVRRIASNGFLTFLGISAAYGVVFDTLHMLAYPGIFVFVDAGTNLASQLWIAGRAIQAITLAGAPFFLVRPTGVKRALGALGLLAAVQLLSIFVWKNFPTTFIEGVGLTQFKHLSEYAISLLMLLGLLLMIRFKSRFEPEMFELLAAATVLTIISELMFTFYSSIDDQMIVYAHLVRVLAFYLVYKALIEGSLLKPYETIFQSLNQSRGELRQKTRELEAHVQELDAFGHTVAHELHGPLASIISSAQSIASFDMPNDEYQAFLDGIVRTGRRMSRIVDELMLLAQIGTAEVLRREVHMGEVLEQALEGMSSFITRHEALIVRQETWPVACGYAPWLEEVWANYISNAIKYGGRPPRLEFGADPMPDGFIRFWLQDNGPGVPAENIDSLFDGYSRPAQSRLGSHGLGLTIVKGIVEKLGGTVGVSVVPGAGSRFYFSLPAPDSQPARPAMPPADEPQKSVSATPA